MIDFEKLCVSRGGLTVLSGIDLHIPKGQFVALVGRSGAGKTTLLKCVNRLIEPDSGKVRIEGADIANVDAHQLRRQIGYVIQGVGLFPHLTVAENIWLSPRLSGATAGRDARVAQLLELVSLPADFGARKPHQLSGGQAQRVGFARALAANPTIMLMDEPFGALDPQSRSELGLAYRALHQQMGLTTLFVTHDMAEALLLADRVVVLGEGQLLADLPPADLWCSQDPTVGALIAPARLQAERLVGLSA